MTFGRDEIRAAAGERPGPLALSWWARDGRWLCAAAPAAIFAAHLAWGAVLPKSALTLSLCGALLLVGAVATEPVRRDLARLRGLGWPAGLFLLVILIALWSMTPVAPGGPHPVWAYVGVSPAASTMDKSQTLLELIKLFGLGSIFMLGASIGTSDTRARTCFNVILALGAAYGFWAFLAFFGGAFGPDVHRLGASFGNPNTSATLFSMLLMLAIGGGVSRARSSSARTRLADTAPFAAAGLIFAACLLATASRGGFTAAAAGLVTFALLQTFAGQTKWSRATISLAAGVALVAALLAIAGDELINRFSTTAFELDGRAQIFALHWSAFKAAPWMGYGLGTFDALNRVLLDAGNIGDLWSVRAAHNVYLSWLEQAGVFGAAAMFAAIGAVIFVTIRRASTRTRFTAPLFALLAADIVILAHGLTDFALETYSIAAFWSLLLGLQFAASRGSRA